MDFDNLISVCKKCHKEIHKSILNEVSFSEKILNQSFIPKNNFDKKSSKYLHYVGIKSIEYIMCFLIVIALLSFGLFF